MTVRNETSTRFMDEVRIISPWAFYIALFIFLLLVTVVGIVPPLADKQAPPMPLMLLMGAFVGSILASFVLLIGYVNRDAGRRGMNRVLWTLLAIFIPNALGIVLYFVLRKARMSNCPQCNAPVEPGFGFCPLCRCRLSPVCPQCQRGVKAGDKFCPYCGEDLGAVIEPVADGGNRNPAIAASNNTT